jgi:hypothetical protein
LATLEPLGSDEAQVIVDIHDGPASLVDRIVQEMALLESHSPAVGSMV